MRIKNIILRDMYSSKLRYYRKESCWQPRQLGQLQINHKPRFFRILEANPFPSPPKWLHRYVTV